MIRKGLFYLTTSLLILLLVSLAMADVPPPPANQNIGLYDTVFTGFSTEECKNIECHGDENIPDRHHSLIPNEGYSCTDCHNLDADGNFLPFRNCSDCHEVSPHHVTDDAQNFECSECHGSFVDDYEDGHVIPTYDTSIITPDSSYKVMNTTTGLKTGGCEACHEPDLLADPEIRSNPNTHHNLTGFSINNCNLCHASDSSTGTPGEGDVGLDIRNCERCHGINSLHNIQYDYDATSGELGFGHIGNNWDCWGCHGWVELDISSSSSLSNSLIAYTTSEGFNMELSGDVVTVPDIERVEPGSVIAGQDTKITIYGKNFINEYKGTPYYSKVVLNDELLEKPLELVPDSITKTEIVVTIPGTLETGTYGLWAVKNGNERSNKVSLTVYEELFVVVYRKGA